MARHKRRRRYGGPIVTIPGLSGLPKLPGLGFLNKNVSVGDAAVGVGVGLVGSAALKSVVKRFAPPSTVAMLGKAAPAVFGVAAGAILYFAEKKSARGAGHAVGATLAGLALTVWEFAKTQFAGSSYLDFNEVTQVNFGRYYGNPNPYGLLIQDNVGPGVNGLLVADHTDALNDLARVSMAPDDDGIASLMAMPSRN